LIEKADEIERKIDITKRDTMQIKKQLIDVRISKIEINKENKLELMLEDQEILDRFAKELKQDEKCILEINDQVN
jgi:hypothetical protein